MKKGLQGGLCLFVIIMMLISTIPVGVMAKAENASKDATAIIQTDEFENDFWYTDVDGGISITAYSGSGGVVIIPSTLNGKKVVAISESAFETTSELTSVTIPDGVTSIGMNAFANCSSLTSVTIPSSVTSIGDLAFSGCGALTSVTIPSSVTAIGDRTFSGCWSLASVTIPRSVTAIGDWAFERCTGLTSVTLPNSVTAIGEGAFFECTGLTSVMIPSSVTAIGDRVFWDCYKLTIYGAQGSYAETYANANGLPFIAKATDALNGIAVTTQPIRTTYMVGQSLNLTGLVVTGTYSDGSTKTETVTADSITSFDSSAPATGQTVTVTVNGKTATFMVNIIDTDIDCSYHTHVQNIGWQDWRTKGEISGTSGLSYRLEGIEIKTNDPGNAGVEYQTHVQNIGWQGWQANGAMSGTSGKSLRLEAIEIRLTGADSGKYDIYYQVHAENFGWLGWAKNGESSGTEGYGVRLEAIEIMVLPKGSAAPGSTVQPFVKK